MELHHKDYCYYIERAKQQQGFKTDLQLNQKLGFKGSVTSLLRKGKMHLSDESMHKLAILANENPELALMNLNYMRAEGDAKNTYKKMIDLLRRSMHMLSVFAIIMLSSAPSNAANISVDMNKRSINQSIYYHIIKLLLKLAEKLRSATFGNPIACYQSA